LTFADFFVINLSDGGIMSEAVPSSHPPQKRVSYKRKRGKNGVKKGPRQCYKCRQTKKIHCWLSPTMPICHSCYVREINVDVCHVCGQTGTVRLRDEAGKATCHKCYQQNRPEEICAVCGELGKIVRRLDDGSGECSRCYQKRRRTKKVGQA